jgi:hypothetical protein
MTPERLMTIAQARGMSMDCLPSGSRPEFTVAEVGQALAGLPIVDQERAYAAFAYRWAGDDSSRSVLYSHLTRAVWLGYEEQPRYVPLAAREGWPRLIREQKYMDRLVKLAILEERCWFTIRMYSLWPVLMADSGFTDMDDELWTRRLSRKYEGVRDILESWCSRARSHAARKLRPAQTDSDENEKTIACACS